VIYAACQFGILSVLAKLGSPSIVGQYALGVRHYDENGHGAHCLLKAIETMSDVIAGHLQKSERLDHVARALNLVRDLQSIPRRFLASPMGEHSAATVE
jgi:hypothetical protein